MKLLSFHGIYVINIVQMFAISKGCFFRTFAVFSKEVYSLERTKFNNTAVERELGKTASKLSTYLRLLNFQNTVMKQNKHEEYTDSFT